MSPTATPKPRQFDVIPGRRYVKVAEVLGGSRSASFFFDTHTGVWHPAESWVKPNKRYRLTAEQIAYVASQLGEQMPGQGKMAAAA